MAIVEPDEAVDVMRLDPSRVRPPVVVVPHLVEMHEFARDAAEIVPHAAKDLLGKVMTAISARVGSARSTLPRLMARNEYLRRCPT